ncbi:GAF domain-containing protein [Hoeflea poritis]|uniref:GAF domain-containing protein n=1 Tax=Hoeflea poritis TaxID=2993659 RepID=A0ABT4VMV5_9HYPH|nr:GAF domain-containing protein [Hoeflea poritis]MDA4845452.1 GAF domain-containing protein [Hoeflea poritis]
MDTFTALHAAAKAACGAQLFTVTLLDRTAGLAWRAYSSHPDDYPVTGTKPMGENDWTRHVLERGETFVANETAEFSSYFSDHALINALGCEAAVNIPVSDDELVQGTINILDKEGHFTPERVAALESLVADNRADLLNAFKAIRDGRNEQSH